MTQSKDKAIVAAQGSNIIIPPNLEALLAKVNSFETSTEAIEDQELSTGEGSSYLAWPHKKELVPLFRASDTTTTFRWSKYVEGVEGKDLPIIKPCRKMKNEDGEDEFTPIESLTMAGGILIHHRSRAGLSTYDEKTGKTTTICQLVGCSKFFPSLNETKFLKDLPEALWPSMHGFDNKTNKPLTDAPNKDVPGNIYGEQGNCRDCITSGNSTYIYIKEENGKDVEKTATCQVRSIAYLYATHLGVWNFSNSSPKPKNTITRNFREKNTFSGNVEKAEKQSLEMFPIESLYDEEGNQLKPFIIAIDLPPSATRGKSTAGSVPLSNYMKVIKLNRNDLGGAYMRDLYTMVGLNIPPVEKGKQTVIHHFEGFTPDGESIYGYTTYNVFTELGETHKKMIQDTMEAKVNVKGKLTAYTSLLAMAAWEDAKVEDAPEEFDPADLKPKDKSEGSDFNGEKTVTVKYAKVDDSSNAENYSSDVVNVEKVEILEDY